MAPLANTPRPPYYAVAFSSLRADSFDDEYAATAARMLELAASQPGYLGMETARGADGLGITLSYWTDLDALHAWGEQVEHRLAQAEGRRRWYERFHLRICRVEMDRRFERTATSR